MFKKPAKKIPGISFLNVSLNIVIQFCKIIDAYQHTLNLRRVCEVKQSEGEKKLIGNFQLLSMKSILSFAANHDVDSKAINWAVLVNTETFIY